MSIIIQNPTFPEDQSPTELRFAFGANWLHFLKSLDEERIRRAEEGLCAMLCCKDLRGKRFLDIGSGSGLSSLAARRRGAIVHSFDYDLQSVACTQALKKKYFDGDANWTIEQGSALDTEYLAKLGHYDVVYSWGVLHHTGQMNKALGNVVPLVTPNGQLFVAIYNDQGFPSRYWTVVKRIYNQSQLGKIGMIAFHAPYLFGLRWIVRAVTGRLALERGMSMWHDMIDWLGGYPFEVATPEFIEDFYVKRGFSLETTRTCGRRMGCNEFVFRKS